MPIYEYKCLDCGAHVEKMQKVSDEPLTSCEVCGGKLEKQWSLSGFQFKGAGWYVTDYSSKLKDTSTENSKTTDKTENTEKTNKAEKTEKTEDTKKSSATESTAKTETASNKSNDTVASSKTDVTSKKE